MTDRVAIHREDGTVQIFQVRQGFVSEMRRFYLERNEDVSGVSGTGSVAEGVQFTDGRCCLRWVAGDTHSTVVYDSIVDLMAIHGHNGGTELKWIDDDGG